MNRRDFLDMRPAICAAGKGVRIENVPPVLVCGREPGYDGEHRDVQWPVTWADPEVEL